MKIKGTDIRLQRIQTLEEFEQLKAFAATFDHSITEMDAKAPLVVVKKNDEWIGYFQMVQSPVLFTAWHPEKCKKRDVLEGMKALSGWARVEASLTNKLPAMTTADLKTKTFTPKIMEKMGLRRLMLELYTIEE